MIFNRIVRFFAWYIAFQRVGRFYGRQLYKVIDGSQESRGQALVILAVSFMATLAFVGLARTAALYISPTLS